MRITRSDLVSMLRLAIPVVLAELGWVSMSIVDTMMVGRLSAEAIGAVSVGSSLFLAVAIFGIGLLLGLDTLVSQAFGAEEMQECSSWLIHGVYLSLMLTPLLSLVMFIPMAVLDSWVTEPKVLELTVPYLTTLTWSIFPLLLYATFRRYLQAQSRVQSVMFALISANLVNATTNWLLVFGNLGFPELGVAGAGWATLISRIYMSTVLLGFILFGKRSGFDQVSFRLEIGRISRLLRLGFPAATQVSLEVGVFAMATTLASRLDAISLAAHQIALSAASFTFMVPLGVSAAGAVSVGQALGKRRPDRASAAGWTALVIGLIFMSFATFAFLVTPGPIVRIFTDQREVLSTGISLLAIAALFQVFDSIQVISTGLLRGIGDTRTPMITSLLCHWLFGLPVGYYLCFVLGWGVQGLWVGLCVGLILVAIWLLNVWWSRIRILTGIGQHPPLFRDVTHRRTDTPTHRRTDAP
jgi:MATE family multidrug resistance protein